MTRRNLDYLYNSKEPDQSTIGMTVIKNSGKPFKSGQKEATIKGFTFHDRTKKLCFTFQEDDSYVECFRCTIIH